MVLCIWLAKNSEFILLNPDTGIGLSACDPSSTWIDHQPRRKESQNAMVHSLCSGRWDRRLQQQVDHPNPMTLGASRSSGWSVSGENLRANRLQMPFLAPL